VSLGTKRFVFPLARRLLTPSGEFAGAVGAPGQVEYFERFYRDTYPDPSTRVRDASGPPIRVAGSVSDIDAYKRVEGQLL